VAPSSGWMKKLNGVTAQNTTVIWQKTTVKHENPSFIALCMLYITYSVEDRQYSYRTAELHLSGLIGKPSHPDMQKIRIIGFFFRRYATMAVCLNFGCYYLQYVPASKPFVYAWFEVLEGITLYCTWSDNR